MAPGPGATLRSAWRSIQPSPRIVDWSILALVCVEVASGLASFTVVTEGWWPLFWLHRAVGLTLIALLAFKLLRVRHRLTNRRHWRPSTALSVLTAIAAGGAIATGIVWVLGLDVRISYFTLLSIHVGFGLALVPLALAHVKTRFRLPRRADVDRRRTTLQYSGLLLAGLVTYRAQEFVNTVADTAGAPRRMTGSQPRTGAGNDAFPVASWVADDPDPVDLGDWQLAVRGAVTEPLTLNYDELSNDAELEALLDCTSGWYTIQDWSGVRVGDLLEATDVDDDAEYVRFVSVTGYRWSLPIEEARDAVLATHVGGEQLSHGHGRPLRLVAPDRRGFQWVKWIDRIDVRHRSDPAQWVVTLVSWLR